MTSSVADGATLVLSGQATVDAGVHETLRIDVPVEFGADFRLNVTNMANRAKGDFTVLRATKSVGALPAAVEIVDDDETGRGAWIASWAKEADGATALRLVYSVGTVLILR